MNIYDSLYINVGYIKYDLAYICNLENAFLDVEI